MQLTRAADYAIRVMIHLAGMPPETRASRSQLAEAAECPEQFLSKVLQHLTHAGLVISHRGNTGGFELARGGQNASLLDVVEAIEGPIRLNDCVGDGHCERFEKCAASATWSEAQAALTAVLDKATISALARSSRLS